MKKKALLTIIIIIFLGVIVVGLKLFPIQNPSLTTKGLPVCRDCNVVLISLDTLGANHLPCYGYGRDTAPNLCGFGKENITFKKMYSNANYTLPSHVSLFTSLYPNQHKIDDSGGNYLPQSVPFMPEILQKAGYGTYFYMGYKSYYEKYPYSPFFPLDTVYYRGINEIHQSYSPSEWDPGLQTLKNNNQRGLKTFLFLHTYWVHKPYKFSSTIQEKFIEDKYKKSAASYGIDKACTQEFISYLKASLTKDIDNHYWEEKPHKAYSELLNMLSYLDISNIKVSCNIANSFEGIDWYYEAFYNKEFRMANKEDRLSYIVDMYDSKIFELDNLLKKVFMFIKQSELQKNTIIIVTSDHGEEFLEHGEWTHGYNLYDTSIRIPLMMYIPGYRQNEVIGNLAQTVDIFPTLLDVLGIQNSYTFSGSNLFRDDRNITSYTMAQHNDGKATIRDDTWKLIYRFNKGQPVGLELFDYKKDPDEKNNILFKNVQVVDRLLGNISYEK